MFGFSCLWRIWRCRALTALGQFTHRAWASTDPRVHGGSCHPWSLADIEGQLYTQGNGVPKRWWLRQTETLVNGRMRRPHTSFNPAKPSNEPRTLSKRIFIYNPNINLLFPEPETLNFSMGIKRGKKWFKGFFERISQFSKSQKTSQASFPRITHGGMSLCQGPIQKHWVMCWNLTFLQFFPKSWGEGVCFLPKHLTQGLTQWRNSKHA